MGEIQPEAVRAATPTAGGTRGTRTLPRRELVVLGAALTIALVVVLVVVLVRACRTESPHLLNASDFEGVDEVVHDEGVPRAWTWCRSLDASDLFGHDGAASRLSFGDGGLAGATLVDGWTVGVPADHNLEHIKDSAERCADGEGPSMIEELTDLDEDAVGWRTESSGGEWGEYVVIKLDDWRVLAVGFSTREPTAPVEIGELVQLAREGAAKFEPDED